MWTYDTKMGLAKILYDSQTGKFIGYFAGEYIGSFITPQRAVLAISRRQNFNFDLDIPDDLDLWHSHHQTVLS